MIRRIPDGDGLRSMDEICAFCSYSEATVKELIAESGFPAVKIGGTWESSKMLVEEWRRNHIRAKLGQDISRRTQEHHSLPLLTAPH